MASPLPPIPADHILAVVLAGGKSRRLGGGDKCLLEIGGRPILDYTLDRVRPQVGCLLINANGDATRFDRWQLPIVQDVLPDWRGPLVGILSAMEWARRHLPRSTHVLSVPADMPLVPRDLASTLWQGRATSGHAAAVASSDGRLNPLLGLWPVDEAPALRTAIVDHGLARAELWARRRSVVIVPVGGGQADPFFNINTPEDLAAAASLAEVGRFGTD